MAEHLFGHCSCCGLSRRRVLSLLGSAVAAPVLGGCDLSGGLPIDIVSEETVERLGLESWQRIRSETAPSRNAEYQELLQVIGTRLLRAAGFDPGDWELVAFAGPEVNAFALPGGRIGVYEGMFAAAANADQLAAVVGHEIGHNTAEHSQERLNAAVARDVGLQIVSVALQLGDIAYANEIAALLGVGVEFGLVLPYSRDQELEADRLGLEMMADAGYRPGQAVEFWRRMEQLDGQRSLALLSTHPAPASRIEALEALIAQGLV